MIHLMMRVIPNRMRSVVTALGAALLIAVVVKPAGAQPFTALKSAVVDYSKADREPREVARR
jgi:hypothetical protein